MVFVLITYLGHVIMKNNEGRDLFIWAIYGLLLGAVGAFISDKFNLYPPNQGVLMMIIFLVWMSSGGFYFAEKERKENEYEQENKEK